MMQIRPHSPNLLRLRGRPPVGPVTVAHPVAGASELPRFGEFPRPLLGLRSPKFGMKVTHPVLINRLEEANQAQGQEELVKLNQLRKDLLASARERGLKPSDVSVYVMPEDTFLQMAARNGYLERYPHWSWGQEYYKMKMPIVLHGIREIREVVVNNDPVKAYLSDAHPAYAQKVLLIHAIARSDFYRNNLHFRHTNRRSVDLMAAHAARIKELEAAHGKEAVESFIDKAHSLRNLIDSSRPPRREERTGKPSESNPERDVLDYFIRHAAPLADWQRDILEMIREESYALAPVEKTSVMADGWACFWNEKLNLENPWFWDLQNTTKEANWTAKLFQLNPVKVNSYKLGYTIFRRLEESLYAKYEGDPQASRKVMRDLLRIRQTEQDTTFLNKYFTKDIAEELLMYTFDPKKQTSSSDYYGYYMGYRPSRPDPQAPGTKLFLSGREFDEIKQKLLAMHVNAGQPVIEIVDGNYRGQGEIYLRHVYDIEDLKKDYAEKTLTRLAQLWGKRVHLETIETQDNGKPRAVILSSTGGSVSRRYL